MPAVRKAPNAKSCGPYGAEVGQALTMIGDGRSDAAIAAQISAGRPHGAKRCDPEHIAKLRKGF